MNSMNAKNSRRNRIAAVGLGAALSFGIAAPVFAQTSATTVNPIATKARPTEAERQAAEAARKAAFAGRLGVTVAQITQADKDQAKADVDKALAAGIINAAQAGAYKTLIDNDNDSDGRGFRVPHVRPATGSEPTQAEREAQRAARLKEYAARLGVTVDAYTKAQKDQAKADVDAAVTAGRITAAQATGMKARIDSSTGGFDGPGNGGPGPGGHGGRGGHGGPGMGGGRGGSDGPGMGGRGMDGPGPDNGPAAAAPTQQA